MHGNQASLLQTFEFGVWVLKGLGCKLLGSWVQGLVQASIKVFG